MRAGEAAPGARGVARLARAQPRSWTCVALLALAACGGSPAPAPSGATARDPSWRDPSFSRSDSYTPARDPERQGRKDGKESKDGRGK